MSKKYRTIEQVKTAQGKAVRFAENVLLDEDKAEELSSLSPEEYADRKRIQIVTPNPNTTERNRTMPKQPTRADLQERIEELEQENAAMAEQLDNIAQIVSPADEDDDDAEYEDDDAQDDDEEADDDDE